MADVANWVVSYIDEDGVYHGDVIGNLTGDNIVIGDGSTTTTLNADTVNVGSEDTDLVDFGHSGQYLVIRMLDLKTTDPNILGELWNNAGALSVSAG